MKMGEPTRRHSKTGAAENWTPRWGSFCILFGALVTVFLIVLVVTRDTEHKVASKPAVSEKSIASNRLEETNRDIVNMSSQRNGKQSQFAREEKKRSNHTKSSFNISFEEMRENYNSMTQVQWEQYSQKLRGRKVEWCGWVEDVERKYLGRCELQVDMDSPKSWGVQEVFFDVSENLAMKLNKDQFICFHGTIESVGKTIFTLYIMLKDVSVQIR